MSHPVVMSFSKFQVLSTGLHTLERGIRRLPQVQGVRLPDRAHAAKVSLQSRALQPRNHHRMWRLLRRRRLRLRIDTGGRLRTVLRPRVQGAPGREYLLHRRTHRGAGFRVCRRLLWKEENAFGRTHLHGMGFNRNFLVPSQG